MKIRVCTYSSYRLSHICERRHGSGAQDWSYKHAMWILFVVVVRLSALSMQRSSVHVTWSSKTPLHSESDCFILLTWWHLAGASLGDLAFLHRERHSSIKSCEGVV